MGLIKATHLRGCFKVKIHEILLARPLAQSWQSVNTASVMILWASRYAPCMYRGTFNRFRAHLLFLLGATLAFSHASP